jgi:hypothetical protein
MSNDFGDPKPSLVPYSANVTERPPAAHADFEPRECRCAFCHLAISRRQPPVLLKSGHRVHLACYLTLKKRAA